MITLQNSEENGIYNPVKLDMYFHLHLVYMYTNLTFTDKQRENEMELYDALQSSGLIDLVVSAIDENVFNKIIEKFDWPEFDEYNEMYYLTNE